VNKILIEKLFGTEMYSLKKDPKNKIKTPAKKNIFIKE
tara:strand:- start:235 stop:348 length:114 start_codon:yes stop_codon:yes gene_type:complete